MITTSEEAKAAVQSLGLPRIFADVWDDNIPITLVDWQRPKRYFSYHNELLKRYPRLATCIPLWESNRDHVYAFDTATNEFITCNYYEERYLEVIADSYQRFAAAYLVECIYSGDEELDEIGSLLEFKHMHELHKFAETDHKDLSADEAKQQFVESIPADR